MELEEINMEWQEEDLESFTKEEIQELLNETSNRCYANLLNMGLDSLGDMGHEQKVLSLNNLLDFFKDQEEFRKCAKIQKYIDILNG